MDDREREELRRLLKQVIEEHMGGVHFRMAAKWHGGRMILQPERDTLQSKEIELEKFFHKLVMIRESLRVLEQKINNHPKLDDEDRLQLQHYLTRVQGSLTTFNTLFRDEEDRFTGVKSED